MSSKKKSPTSAGPQLKVTSQSTPSSPAKAAAKDANPAKAKQNYGSLILKKLREIEERLDRIESRL